MRGLRIEGYDLPQVEERPINGPEVPTQAPAAAFGGGEIAQEASNQGTALGQDVAHRAEATYRDEYRNGVQLQGLELANQLTAEETRAKNALAQVKGKDALAARDQTLQDYDKFYGNLTKGIQNNDVKQLAQEHYAQRRNTLDAWATPYANGQVEEFDNNEILSSIKNEQDSAATDPSPANVAVSVMSQKLALAEFGQRNGRGEEWIKAKQLEASSSTHLEALKAIVNAHQDITAREFFDRNKDQFVGNDVARAEELIKAGSSLAEAMRVRDTIFSVTHEEVKGKDGQVSIKSTPPPITEAEVRDRLNELTKGMDPATRLEAERLSFNQWTQERQIQAAAENDRFSKAYNALMQGQDVPLSDRLELSPQHQKDLVQIERPQRMKDDEAVVLKADFLSDQDLAKMTPGDMIEFHKGMSDGTWSKFQARVQRARTRDDNLQFKPTGSDNRLVSEAAGSVGISGITLDNVRKNKLTPEKTTALKEFKDSVFAELEARTQDKGKPLTYEEKKQAVNDLAIEKSVKDSLKPHWYDWIIGQKWIQVDDAEKARINATVKRLTGKDATDEKIQLLKRAEMLKASPAELRKLAGE